MMNILVQSPVAHFEKSKLPLDDPKLMFHLGSDAGFVFVSGAFFVGQLSISAVLRLCEVLCLWSTKGREAPGSRARSPRSGLPSESVWCGCRCQYGPSYRSTIDCLCAPDAFLGCVPSCCSWWNWVRCASPSNSGICRWWSHRELLFTGFLAKFLESVVRQRLLAHKFHPITTVVCINRLWQ